MINDIYSETCFNRISLGPTFVFRIDRCSAYKGQIHKYFLYADLIYSLVYECKGLQFIQGSG